MKTWCLQWFIACLLACPLPLMAQTDPSALYTLGKAHLEAGKEGLDYLGESPPEVDECGGDEWSDRPCHYIKAREYLTQALAMNLHPPEKASALIALGNIYRDGLGVVIDYAQAARYYQQALEEGNDAEVLGELGWFYLHGLGVEKNPALAKHYLSRLERGVLNIGWDFGLNYLAYMYHHGGIVQKDPERARCYLEKHLHWTSSSDINACAPEEVVNRVFQAADACNQKNPYTGERDGCIVEEVINNEAISLDR